MPPDALSWCYALNWQREAEKAAERVLGKPAVQLQQVQVCTDAPNGLLHSASDPVAGQHGTDGPRKEPESPMHGERSQLLQKA